MSPPPHREGVGARGRAPHRWVLAALAVLLAVELAPAQPRGGTVAPSDAPWSARMTPDGEPGEPLVVEGTVRGAGGKALAGVSVFAYQTGADGIYGPKGNADPRLRVSLRTDERGRYRFETVRPGSYPGTRVPAHIHFHVTPPGGREGVSEVVFEGDPFVTARMRADPFFAVRPVERGADGVGRVTYDVAIED
jgi:protocatechuate 3,4-dioxygenase beta subunit